MKKLSILLLLLTACGFESRDNEVIGQVKRVHNNTPIFCSNWADVDFSMGVMKNGTGSVSKEDLYLTIPDKSMEASLKAAAESSAIVKITYDQKRLAICTHAYQITKVEILK